jgi:hypothetical protein
MLVWLLVLLLVLISVYVVYKFVFISSGKSIIKHKQHYTFKI